MKKIISFSIGVLSYFLIIILFNGWDNIITHQQINNVVVSKFLDKVKDKNFSPGKFTNYSFNWSGANAPLLEGDEFSAATSENLLQDPVNVVKNYSPVDWITKGGWMEDVAWGPAALRHFYDPLAIDGTSYLTDRSGKVESILSPIMYWSTYTAKDWSTNSKNPYSWNQAKLYVVKALKDPSQRNRNMALAYRCLGQVMHLISDMGCPPHVRNDSHPPNAYCIIGDPDPTEVLGARLDAGTIASARLPNSYLSSQFAKAENISTIFDKLASYVNSNFFSNQTINSDKYKPVIRPNNPYPNPLVTQANYNPNDHTYYMNYDNYDVKMCKDLHPVPLGLGTFIGKDSIRGIPYIDYDCVKSQIASILPNVTEAGINLIRMFVPSLDVTITEAKTDSGGVIRGKVSYTIPSINDEYSGGLFDLKNIYNGIVSLYLNGKKLNAITEATKNAFTFKLAGSGTTIQDADKVIAEIEFGGISIKSSETSVKGVPLEKVTVQFSKVYSDGFLGKNGNTINVTFSADIIGEKGIGLKSVADYITGPTTYPGIDTTNYYSLEVKVLPKTLSAKLVNLKVSFSDPATKEVLSGAYSIYRFIGWDSLQVFGIGKSFSIKGSSASITSSSSENLKFPSYVDVGWGLFEQWYSPNQNKVLQQRTHHKYSVRFGY